jgi:hypothetical protein
MSKINPLNRLGGAPTLLPEADTRPGTGTSCNGSIAAILARKWRSQTDAATTPGPPAAGPFPFVFIAFSGF